MGTQRESNDTPKNNNNIQETPLSGTLETTLSDPSSVFAARRKIRCMEKGWGHTFKGEKCGGYYIGGPHRSFTEVMVVRGVDKVSWGRLGLEFGFVLFMTVFFFFFFFRRTKTLTLLNVKKESQVSPPSPFLIIPPFIQ